MGSWRTHQYDGLAGRAGMGNAVTPTSAAQIKWAQEGRKCPRVPSVQVMCVGQVASVNEAPSPWQGTHKFGDNSEAKNVYFKKSSRHSP